MRVCRTVGRYVLLLAILAPLSVLSQDDKKGNVLPDQAKVNIRNIIPVVSATSVRIDTLLELEDVAPGLRMGLLAEIREWPSGELLWEGSCGIADFRRRWETVVSRTIPNLKPKLWSPETPNLYEVTVQVGSLRKAKVRFGFRSVESRDGQIFLNGKPIFLRGNAINPPGRGMNEGVGQDRAFAERYVRELKARNVNCIRTVSPVWLDVCDELGMLAITGNYAPPPGSTRDAGQLIPPLDLKKAVRAYKHDMFQHDIRHPSVVMFILSNEMPNRGRYGEMFDVFLDSVFVEMKAWDPSRLYIANAGLGGERIGDVNDWHAYAGWYGGNFLNYYGLRSERVSDKPMTFTECVGAFTEAGGRFRVYGRQLAASLAWAGHAADQSGVALAYQALLTKRTIEICRRLREQAPSLSAMFPCSSVFYHWDGVKTFDEMGVKPALEVCRDAYSPVLLSWESWTPNLYAGSVLRVFAHVVNDSAAGSEVKDLKLVFAVKDEAGRSVTQGELVLGDIPYYAVIKKELRIALPPELGSGTYRLEGDLFSGDRKVAQNAEELFVADRTWSSMERPPVSPVMLYDTNGMTAAALGRLRIPFTAVTNVTALRPGSVLLVGADAWDAELSRQKDTLRGFVRGGGRVVLLRQEVSQFESDWLPAQLEVVTGKEDVGIPGMYVNPERTEHPVFAHIPRERLRVWSDPSGWTEDREGHPNIYPVRLGFDVADGVGLENVAVLANYGMGLANMALCEVFDGEGSVLVSGFDMVSRTRWDPVADRLLVNLLSHALSPEGHERYPYVDTPIQWGDYVSERGVICGPRFGLLANVVSRPVPREGSPEITSVETVPSGRRPYGPFRYGPKGRILVEEETETGSGRFFVRVVAGRRRMVSTVRNPDAEKAATIRFSVNGLAGEAVTVAPGAEARVVNNLPPNTTALDVGVEGSRHAVLVSTQFE